MALDSPVRTLFERVAAPAARDVPDLEAIGAALVDLTADVDYMRRWTERIAGATGRGTGSMAIHAPSRGPRLMIVHRPEGEMSAPHDHGTWVALAPILGIETHRRYRSTGERSADRLELVESLALVPSDVVTLLPPDDIHDHGHIAGRGEPAYVLIMTGDDQTRFTRNEWDLATGRRRTLGPGETGRWLASEPMP
jgi:predicted metal-dependent enzyme (double-stranded beta helix superfamily)